ncbi:MAG TPA: DoxX family protein [Pseudobdellovibrionaceae bacterium]|jgi:putative oxidoreductase
MNFLKKLIRTEDDLVFFILRFVLGVVFFPHGAQKVLGWFGGGGFTGTMGFFTSQGIPAFFALMAILAEFAGSLGLILGLLTRVAAFGITCVMMVAIFTVHLPNGFFMNWTGKQAGEGFEYHLLVLAISSVLMWKGAGAYSLDRKLSS